jgi:flagellar transcriptional activator FlhD
MKCRNKATLATKKYISETSAVLNKTRMKRESTMQTEQLLAEIREANLAYLMLAQHMIQEDRPQALYRLGLSEEVAGLIGALTPGQVMKISGGNMLMCRFRFDDEIVWNLLSSAGKVGNVNGLHADILMAGRMAEAT